MDDNTRRDYLADVLDERSRLLAENEKLRRLNEALLDVKNAAQQLVDLIHFQQNTTSGNTFAKAYDNLKDALKAWYMPNGTGR